MKTDEQIKAEARQSGHIEVERLQLEVLLDIRAHLGVLAEKAQRKPGRPRTKQRDVSQPAGK